MKNEQASLELDYQTAKEVMLTLIAAFFGLAVTLSTLSESSQFYTATVIAFFTAGIGTLVLIGVFYHSYKKLKNFLEN